MSSSQTPSSSNSGHDVSQSSAVDKNDNKNKDVLKRHANKHPSSCATPSSASASPPSPSIPLSPILPPSPRSSSPRLSRRSTLHKPLPSIHFEKAPVPTWTSESQRPVGLPPCVIHSPDGGRYVWFAAVDTDGSPLHFLVRVDDSDEFRQFVNHTLYSVIGIACEGFVVRVKYIPKDAISNALIFFETGDELCISYYQPHFMSSSATGRVVFASDQDRANFRVRLEAVINDVRDESKSDSVFHRHRVRKYERSCHSCMDDIQ